MPGPSCTGAQVTKPRRPLPALSTSERHITPAPEETFLEETFHSAPRSLK